MKSTGIVRKIDDLGRIVMPKEIRKTLNINEGDTIEIYTGDNGDIILKKFSIIGEIKQFAKDYADSLYTSSSFVTMITDRDSVIAVAGDLDFLEGEKVSKELDKLMSDRDSVYNKQERNYISFTSNERERHYKYQLLEPIVSNGDSIGCIAFISDAVELGSVEKKLLETASKFLGNQMLQ